MKLLLKLGPPLMMLAVLAPAAGQAAEKDGATGHGPPPGAADESDEEGPTPAEAEETAPPDPIDVVFENTLDMCQDGEDNDGDGHVDCDDQDCEIFAICAPTPQEEASAAPARQVAPFVHFPAVETGVQCRDGLDNDNNGQIDCFDLSCQRSHYCRRVMYERPEPRDKPPGLIIAMGMGTAMPNYRMPTAETSWQDPNSGDAYEIPFDPDMGMMLDLQIGYMFMKWIGAGVGFKSAFTFASNRSLYFLSDDDVNDYKYIGSKYYGNISGFLRLQLPLGRIVPYLGLHFGYSVYQNTWHVYDALNSWSDIDDFEVDDSSHIIGDRTEIRSERRRHFTFSLQPGVDIYPVKRLLGIGLKLWLPVTASENPEADNIGVLFNMTVTPTWREPLQLKPQYRGASE